MVLRCPRCESSLSYVVVRLQEPFECPACGRWLEVPSWCWKLTVVPSLLVAGLVPYALGLRGGSLLLAVIALWWPINVVALVILKRMPLKLESFPR